MRLKIIAGNLAVVLLVGVATFAMISEALRSQLMSRLDAGLGNDRTLFERSYRLSAMEFTDLVQERAAMEQVRSVFSGLDESSRRTRAYEVAEATHAWLADPARGGRGAPDIVVVADETGKALARNGARNVMFGKALLPEIPALRNVLKTGQAAHDVWVEDQQQKVLQTAIAAIRNQAGTILGALIVGYDLSNGVASREALLLGREVAFVVSDKVYSASTTSAVTRGLNKALFGRFREETRAVLAGQLAVSRAWVVDLSGEEYSGLVARLPMSPSLPIAFALMGNRATATAPADVANVALVMMLLGAVMVIGYGFVIGGGIMRAIERIEDGVLAVINGRTELRLETDSPELGGLAFRINQLLNVFTGTEEVAVEGDEQNGSVVGGQNVWRGGDLTGDGRSSDHEAERAPGGNGVTAAEDVVDDDAVAATLAAEPEAEYDERVYQEYVAAKQALGENVSNIPKDRFRKRLSGRAVVLAQKHGCRTVRFQVHTRDNQVVLRPVLIR